MGKMGWMNNIECLWGWNEVMYEINYHILTFVFRITIK